MSAFKGIADSPNAVPAFPRRFAGKLDASGNLAFCAGLCFEGSAAQEAAVAKQPGFWDVEERSEEISADGGPLETPDIAVVFERFRPILEPAAGKPPGPKGGRPALDVVPEFRMLVLQSLRGLSLAPTEAMVHDRPGWMRFCGIELRDKAPDAATLRDFHEALTGAGAHDDLFRELDWVINEVGYIPRFGWITDASLVSAPRRRAGTDEKAAIKAGQAAGEIWPDEPRQGGAEGHGRVLGRQIPQGEAPAGRREADGHRHPGLWPQVPHLHRPEARDHPQPGRRGRRRPVA